MSSDRHPSFQVRAAQAEDASFIREMARHAATLEDEPLPAPDADDVEGLLPGPGDVALIAEGDARLGAAWWQSAGASLVPSTPDAFEVVMAVAPNHRRQGIGTALLEALILQASAVRDATLVLNVHLRNAAALHVYMNCGFRVAGTGRGWFGVAMEHPLTER